MANSDKHFYFIPRKKKRGLSIRAKTTKGRMEELNSVSLNESISII